MKWNQVYNAVRIPIGNISFLNMMRFEIVELELIHTFKRNGKIVREIVCPQGLRCYIRKVEAVGIRRYPDHAYIKVNIELTYAKPEGFMTIIREFESEEYILRFDQNLRCEDLPSKMFIDSHAPRDILKTWKQAA